MGTNCPICAPGASLTISPGMAAIAASARVIFPGATSRIPGSRIFAAVVKVPVSERFFSARRPLKMAWNSYSAFACSPVRPMACETPCCVDLAHCRLPPSLRRNSTVPTPSFCGVSHRIAAPSLSMQATRRFLNSTSGNSACGRTSRSFSASKTILFSGLKSLRSRTLFWKIIGLSAKSASQRLPIPLQTTLPPKKLLRITAGSALLSA